MNQVPTRNYAITSKDCERWC